MLLLLHAFCFCIYFCVFLFHYTSSTCLPCGRWRLEEISTSTRTNAIYSLDEVERQGWVHLVIVTNPFHQLRSYYVFRRVLIERGLQDRVQVRARVWRVLQKTILPEPLTSLLGLDCVVLLRMQLKTKTKRTGIRIYPTIMMSRHMNQAACWLCATKKKCMLSCQGPFSAWWLLCALHCIPLSPLLACLPGVDIAWHPPITLCAPMQLFVADAPCAGHHGYHNRMLDALMDQWDFWREVLALAYYYVRGWL
jgi:hypothetical protein